MKSKAVSLIANRTETHLQSIIAELIEDDHPDNAVILGHVKIGNRCIQVQLHVTQEQAQFMEWLG